MNALPTILAASAVDAPEVVRSDGWSVTWHSLGVEAPGTGISFRALFGRTDATFRRLDRMTRALVVAVEACALDTRLSDAEREDTGLVVETACGSVELDLAYTRALASGNVRVSLFPYTLQSTCLGDVALRHGLCGPTLSLSVARGGEGEALREARRMLARGELRRVVVGSVDALGEAVHGAEPVLRAVACVVAAPGTGAPSGGGELAWSEDADAFTRIADACRRAARTRAALAGP
jgi:3-oxoacyl-(acyl-carrier-protein) synthase